MPPLTRLVATLVSIIVGIAVMVVLATITFYIVVFVVSTGARLAGFRPAADFVVLAAAIIVFAIVVTGGITPRLVESEAAVDRMAEPDDPTYD